jgi:hypothetical protein
VLPTRAWRDVCAVDKAMTRPTLLLSGRIDVRAAEMVKWARAQFRCVSVGRGEGSRMRTTS